MATNARIPPQPQTNGVITAPPKGLTGGNRKKQKRRAKNAARNNPEDVPPPVAQPTPHPAEVDYDEDPLRYDDEEYDEEYSDNEPQHYHDHYAPSQAASNGYAIPPPAKNRKKNKKKRSSHHYSPDLLSSAMPSLPTPPPPSQHTSAAALRTMHKSVANHPNIWNTSTQQERQNIKDFWLSLSEEERKSLLKIEKEAVLRKMKQQQKHSCSCTVCGRKRTAIEEELEVLYEGYYEELEQYAHHDPLPTDGMLPEPLQHRPRLPHPLAAPPPNPRHRSSQMLEHLDEEEEISEEEEYSDEEEDDEEDEEDDDEEDYSDEEPEPPRGPVPDFFNFGQNLTVKGILTPWLEKLQSGLKGKTDNLLTVADDLLKNDGRKFIEMMEQLAERRMQRESEAEYAAANPSHPNTYPPNDPAYNHEDPLAAGDEYDDEEASYDSNEEYDDDLEEEDEMGGLTEEQRMQEGRRMFQIFAARMFEQRVLTAYKERVAKERQQQLIKELEGEEEEKKLKEEKKRRDAEKRKEKKRIQNLAKAEEKERKEAEKAAEEARLKAIEEKKQEEARRKREEQRKKKEEERRKQEEEKARKEAEKQRRHLEEQQRREEAERKAREQRAAEKAKKEEARKREREDREAREKEAKERKAQEEKDRKERDAKAKADREAKERERSNRQSNPPQIAKRASQAGMVAVPGVHSKPSPSGISSPHTAVATPAVPKAPTPARQKQPSQHGSHASSPMQPQSQVSSAPSKSSSPGSAVSQQQSSNSSRSFVQKGPQQGAHPPHQMSSPLHQQVQPPPGMQHMQHHQGAFGGMPPLGFQAFQGPQGPMIHNMGQRGPMPMYGHQGPPMGMPNRMSPFGPPGMNGMNGMNGPPGMMHPHGRGMGFPFDQPGVGAPPGFGPQMPQHQSNQTSPLGPPMSNGVPGTEVPRPSLSVHSRQQSTDKFSLGGAGQPIARPAPIQRPGSMQSPGGEGSISPRAEAEAPSKHLGSSALLDDSDEPIPQNESRRMSHNVLPTSTRSQSLGIGGLFPQAGGFGTPGTSWASPVLPLGQSPGLGQQQWGSLPNASHMTGWANNNTGFATNGAFGPMGVGTQLPMQMHRPSGFGGQSRPLTIRLAICQACKQLGATNPSSDGFHDINAILRQMPVLQPPPSHPELEAICETEGDSQNGGGELSARKSASGGEVIAVKWTPDSGTPKDQGRGSHAGLGEIGSPMPSRTSPAGIAFERPGGFPNLGAVGSPGY